MPNIEESLLHQESDKIDLSIPSILQTTHDHSSNNKTFKPVSILRCDSSQQNRATSKDSNSSNISNPAAKSQQERRTLHSQRQQQGQGQGQTSRQNTQLQSHTSLMSSTWS